MTTPSLNGVLDYLRHAVAADDTAADAELLRRFVQERDQTAFELLVWRHSRLVLGVCQRVLGNLHDAEDAFQATFLTLARRAAAIRRRPALAGWLYHVAYHVALDARKLSVRRREQAMALPQAIDDRDPVAEAAARELLAVVDEEVNRLPGKYRVPFILCCLAGQTNAEAARQCRCAVGTIESRLSRARQRLKQRLQRRGFSSFAGLFVTGLASDNLIRATAGLVSPRGPAFRPEVAALSKGALRTMILTRLKSSALTALVLLLVGAAGMLGYGAWSRGDGSPALPAVSQALPSEKPQPPAAQPPSSKKLLDQAIQVANDMKWHDQVTLQHKVLAFVHIGWAQTAAGDKEGASKSYLTAKELVTGSRYDFAQIMHTWRMITLLCVVAESQAQQGDIKAAQDTIAYVKRLNEDPADHPTLSIYCNRSLTEIAAAQVRAGDSKAALQTAEELLPPLKDANTKTDVYRRIALEQAQRKEAEAARQTATRFEPLPVRIGLLLQIAKVLKSRGDEGAASETYLQAFTLVRELKKEAEILKVALTELATALAQYREEEMVLHWLDSKQSAQVKTAVLVGLAQGAASRNAR